MKFKILCLFFLMQSATVSFAQWTSINLGIGQTLTKVQFTTNNTGYASGFFPSHPPFISSIIIKTSDQGNSWDTLFYSPIEIVTDLSSPTPNKAYVVTRVSRIIKLSINPNLAPTFITTNAPPDTVEITPSLVTAFYFINNTTGFAGDNSGRVYKTINGGVSWTNGISVDVTNTSVLESFAFLSNNTAIVVGHNSPIIARTVDGGSTWSPVSYDFQLNAVCAPSAGVIYAVGDAVGTNNTLVKSIDQGITWTPLSFTDTLTNFNSIYCPNNNVCYAVGDNGIIIKTTDGGSIWSRQNSGTTANLNSVHCTNPNECYVAGGNGTMLKTTSGGNRIDLRELAQEFLMYPNPASDILNFIFKNTDSKQINIYNAFGQIVFQTSVDQRAFALETSCLYKGVYFVEVITGKQSIVNKLVKQ